jgi:hypothetical protein
MTYIETENLIVEKEKELKELLDNLNKVEQAKLNIGKQGLFKSIFKSNIE